LAEPIDFKSSIYEAKVYHTRLKGVKNIFSYGVYTFLLDLAEIDTLDKNYFLFARNRFSLFSFYDKDHLDLGEADIQKNIHAYIRKEGYKGTIGKIFLLTNLRVLGYVFNPVSFYFILNEEAEKVCAIAQVGNTFGEMKPYFFPKPVTEGDFDFVLEADKFFYVSPYISLDSKFIFKLKMPSEQLKIQVDSYESGEKVLGTAYTGKKKEFNNSKLLLYFLKYPFVTVKVIGAIHIQALKLYMNKLPFLKKSDHQELQRGVFLGKNNHSEHI
jgi:DUF1365 family protein